MKPIVRFDNVTKRYRREVALDGLSLEVPAGTVFALLGENGAGKTTALKIALGMVEPDAGRAECLGFDSRLAGQEIRRRVGYVPERPTFYDWMSVTEVGWFTAGFYPEGFFANYLDLARHYELPADRKLKELSKGMRAKVALALATAHEPEVLVLDEPTSGLDPLVRREFLQSMVDVAAEGRGVVISSHQIAEVERVADLVAILDTGRLLLVDRLENLKNELRELTVTLANGSPPPDLAGTIVSSQQMGRQWRFLVRGFSDGEQAHLRENEAVQSLEVRVPSLEEIFVGYVKRNSEE